MCIIYIYIYIYIHIYIEREREREELFDRGSEALSGYSTETDLNGFIRIRVLLHPVSVRRFASFRTQPLENISRFL